MIVVAIDPGMSGAFCVMNEDKEVIAFGDTPTYNHNDTKGKIKRSVNCRTLYDVLAYHTAGHETVSYVIEDVHSMPTDGKVSSDTFGKATGSAQAILEILANGPFVKKVAPLRWKNHFGLKGQPKRASVELARDLYPDIAKKLLISYDGRSEAILIARFFVEKFGNGDNQ